MALARHLVAACCCCCWRSVLCPGAGAVCLVQLWRAGSGDCPSQRPKQQQPQRRDSHSHRFRISGGEEAVGGVVEDSGTNYQTAGGGRQRRQRRRHPGDAGQCRHSRCHRQGQGGHRVLQGRSGRGAAAGAPSGRATPGRGNVTGCPRRCQGQGGIGGSSHRAEQGQPASTASQSRFHYHSRRLALFCSMANLQVQQANLDFTTIRAPFAGIVVKKMTESGESVAPIPPGVNISTSSGAIVAIADMNSLEAEVDVNESNVGQLFQGYPADITVQAIPDHTYKGVLRQVIPTADRTKATVTVKVSILDKDGLIKPEMSCNVTFLEPKKGDQKEVVALHIVTVPKDALTTRNGKQVVYVIENNKAHEVAVVTGNELKGQVIIKSGLAGTESLVNNPPQKVQDGSSVKTKS